MFGRSLGITFWKTARATHKRQPVVRVPAVIPKYKAVGACSSLMELNDKRRKTPEAQTRIKASVASERDTNLFII